MRLCWVMRCTSKKKNDITRLDCLLWPCALSTFCSVMLHVCQSASLSASRALSGGNAHSRGGSGLELKELSYISPYDDCCGVFGPAEAIQHSVCASAFAAFARDYCDDFIFLLLASQAPTWETSYKICAVRGALQESRWVQWRPAASHHQTAWSTIMCTLCFLVCLCW